MRFWFSRVPAYPQWISDIGVLICGVAYLCIAMVVTGTGWSDGSPPSAIRSMIAALGILCAIGLLGTVVGHAWARYRGLEFISRRSARERRLAASAARPFHAFLLRIGLSSLLVAASTQVLRGLSFWRSEFWTGVPWMMAGMLAGAVIGHVLVRPKPDYSGLAQPGEVTYADPPRSMG